MSVQQLVSLISALVTEIIPLNSTELNQLQKLNRNDVITRHENE